MRRRYLLAAVLLVVVVVGGFSAFLLVPRQTTGCPPVLNRPVARSQLSSSSFGAVTTFSLPGQQRWPNAIEVAPDGSIWFGEQAVPGLAHFYPENGTLVEYAFPGDYTPSQTGRTCSLKTDIWGIALWDGRVWATDAAQNRLMGLSPANDSFRVVPLPGNNTFPYTLTPGPKGGLWFTQPLSGQVGTLFTNGSVVEHSVLLAEQLSGQPLSVKVRGEPDQIVFASASLGYYVDSSPVVNGSAIYAFDPGSFNPVQVGGTNQTLYSPDSIALGDGGIWLAQHGDSSVAFYDLERGSWTIYPTSTVGYVATTLPYFVKTNGSLVWFNEHYGNRMAVMDTSTKTLTEYSVSDPPASNMSQIDNPLTFAIDGGNAWFTELTGNRIGFVDGAYRPSFSVSTNASSGLSIRRGENATVAMDLTGTSSSPLSIKSSISLLTSSAQGKITLRPETGTAVSLNGSQTVAVDVGVGSGVAPGRYTLLLTATDGLVSRSAYVELSVLP